MYTPVTLIFSQTQPPCIVFGLEPIQVYQDFLFLVILKLQMLHIIKVFPRSIGGGRWYTFVTPENLPNLTKNVGINLTILLFCLKRPSDDVKYIGNNRRPILICLFQTKSKKRHFH